MTALQAMEHILTNWLRREEEVRLKLMELRNEQLAYTDLLRTIGAQVVAAKLAVAAAKEAPVKRRVT